MAEKKKQNLAPILDRSGDPATVAWAHHGTGDVATLPDPLLAIDAAAELGNVAALQSVTSPKDLKKAAAAALHRVRSRGVKVETPVAQRSFALGKEAITLPSRAFLSVPDPQGEIELLLTVSDDEGSCVLGVIVGGTGSVRDARHAHVGRGELREIWKKVDCREDTAEIPFGAGLHYADAWLGPSRDHSWTHFLEHVSPATLAAARILDPSRAFPAADAADAPTTPKWMVPADLLDAKVIAGAVQATLDAFMGGEQEEVAPKIDALVTEIAASAFTDAARANVTQAAELAATTFRFRGWSAQAEMASEIGRQAASGIPGNEIEAVTAAVRAALVMGALQRISPQQGMGGAGYEEEE
jgi:hypothetical protein